MVECIGLEIDKIWWNIAYTSPSVGYTERVALFRGASGGGINTMSGMYIVLVHIIN